MDMVMYRLFVQVVESQTLAAAASELHVTQPTVTRQLQQLEQQLGMRLFERTGRALALNEAGERVYRHAKRVLSMEQKLRDDLGGLRDPASGTVHVGAGSTPSIYLLPTLFATYRVAYPEVQFQVRTGSSAEVVDWLVQREVDLGVVTTVPESSADFRTASLIEDELRLVVRPDHPLAAATDVSLPALAAFPLVLMLPSSGLRKMVESLAAAQSVSLRAAMETDNLESINRLVQAGVGAAFLPESAVQEDVKAGRLKTLSIRDVELGARTITLLERRGTLPAAAEQFSQFLQARSRS